MEQEYIVEINGRKFDTRDIYDRLYLESIGYDFENKKNKEEVKSEENKKVEKVEYDENGRQVFNCPMNTAYIKDKKMDYKTLGIMTIFSNRKSEVVARDISEAEIKAYATTQAMTVTDLINTALWYCQDNNIDLAIWRINQVRKQQG